MCLGFVQRLTLWTRPPRECSVQVVRYLHDEGTEIAKGEAIPPR